MQMAFTSRLFVLSTIIIDLLELVCPLRVVKEGPQIVTVRVVSTVHDVQARCQDVRLVLVLRVPFVIDLELRLNLLHGQGFDFGILGMPPDLKEVEKHANWALTLEHSESI